MNDPTIDYRLEPDLSADEFIAVLERSSLAERRPVNEPDRIQRMLAGADILLTARDPAADGLLVGVSRCISDFAYCCYCSDLAVDRAYQGQGIGRRLLEESRAAFGGRGAFLLISAPGAASYYEHIGLPRLANVFGIINRD